MDNKWIKILALIFANGVNYLISFLTAPFLSRTLSYEDNGTYNQILLLVNFFVLLAQFGIINIITVYFADKRYGHSVTFFTSLRVLVFSAGCATLLFASGVFYMHNVLNNPALQKYIVVAVPALFFQSLGSAVTIVLIYFNKIKVVSLFTIISNIVRVLGMFVCVQVLKSVDALIWWFTISTLIQNGILFLFIPKNLTRAPYKYDKVLQSEMLSKAWPLLLTSLLGVGVVYIDGFMVSGMLSVKEYALYRNGAIEIPFIATIYNSIASIMLPNFAKLYGENKIDELIKEKREISRFIAALIFPIIISMIVFSDKLIPLYLSDKYYESYMIFAVYNLTSLIRVNDYQDLLTISGKSKVILMVNVLTFIFNIVANIILLKLFGIIGCAIAFAGTVYLLAFLLSVYTSQTFEIKLKEYIDYHAMLLMLVIGTVFCVVFKMVLNAQPLVVWFSGIGLSVVLSYVLFYMINLLPIQKVFLLFRKKQHDI